MLFVQVVLIFFIARTRGSTTDVTNIDDDQKNADQFAEKLEGFITTMMPDAARVAAYAIHGKWFGWGKAKDKALVSSSRIKLLSHFSLNVYKSNEVL